MWYLFKHSIIIQSENRSHWTCNGKFTPLQWWKASAWWDQKYHRLYIIEFVVSMPRTHVRIIQLEPRMVGWEWWRIMYWSGATYADKCCLSEAVIYWPKILHFTLIRRLSPPSERRQLSVPGKGCVRNMYPMFPVSLDCPFLIAPSVFSTVYLNPFRKYYFLSPGGHFGWEIGTKRGNNEGQQLWIIHSCQLLILLTFWVLVRIKNIHIPLSL